MRIDQVSYCFINTEILWSYKVFRIGIISHYIGIDTNFQSIDGLQCLHIFIGRLWFCEHIFERSIGLLELMHNSILVIINRTHYIGQSSDNPTSDTRGIVLCKTIEGRL